MHAFLAIIVSNLLLSGSPVTAIVQPTIKNSNLLEKISKNVSDWLQKVCFDFPFCFVHDHVSLSQWDTHPFQQWSPYYNESVVYEKHFLAIKWKGTTFLLDVLRQEKYKFLVIIEIQSPGAWCSRWCNRDQYILLIFLLIFLLSYGSIKRL